MVGSIAKYQKYAEYKDSGVEWLGEIPNHWDIKYSKWLFEERNTKAKANDEMLTASQKYGVIPQKLFMELEQQKVVQVLLGQDILKRALINDFVISMRSFQGGIEFCGFTGAISSAYVPLKPRQDLCITYYKYLFKSLPYIQALQATTNLVRDGQALRFSNFIQVRIPLLPFSDAKNIAAFLDHETAKIDSLIEKQQLLIQLLKEKRQAVISNAVTKGLNPNAPMKDSGVEWLGKVPEHWIISKVGFHTSKIGSGKTPRGGSEVYQEEGILFLRSQNIYNDGLKVEDHNSVFISDETHEEMKGSQVQSGDILLNITGGSIGRSCLVPEGFCEANVNQHVSIIRMPKTLQKFISFVMTSVLIQEQIDASQTGGNREGLNFEQMSKLIFCLPPELERNEIIKSVQLSLDKLNALEHKAESAISLMQERRTALISAAVTGKIDVRDWQAPAQTEPNLECSA